MGERNEERGDPQGARLLNGGGELVNLLELLKKVKTRSVILT